MYFIQKFVSFTKDLFDPVLPCGSDSKESAYNSRDLGLIPGLRSSLEKKMATHSHILAWRIPWTEEHGELQSMGLQVVRHDWATNTFTFTTSLKCFKPFFLISSSPGLSIYAYTCRSTLMFLNVIFSWFSFLSLKLYILHCHLLILHHNLFILSPFLPSFFFLTLSNALPFPWFFTWAGGI